MVAEPVYEVPRLDIIRIRQPSAPNNEFIIPLSHCKYLKIILPFLKLQNEMILILRSVLRVSTKTSKITCSNLPLLNGKYTVSAHEGENAR